MDLLGWIYDHPTLALAIAGAGWGVVKWGLSVNGKLQSIVEALKEIGANLKEHDSRLDNHEVRLSLLEKDQDHGKASGVSEGPSR